MDEIKREIEALEARLAALKANLPAHSIPPAMMAELDDLDERLAQARARLEETRKEQERSSDSPPEA